MLNSIITTNGFLSKYQVGKLALRHGYATRTPLPPQWKKKSNNVLLQVQNNFVSLMLKALVKSYTPPRKFSSWHATSKFFHQKF